MRGAGPAAWVGDAEVGEADGVPVPDAGSVAAVRAAPQPVSSSADAAAAANDRRDGQEVRVTMTSPWISERTNWYQDATVDAPAGLKATRTVTARHAPLRSGTRPGRRGVTRWGAARGLCELAAVPAPWSLPADTPARIPLLVGPDRARGVRLSPAASTRADRPMAGYAVGAGAVGRQTDGRRGSTAQRRTTEYAPPLTPATGVVRARAVTVRVGPFQPAGRQRCAVTSSYVRISHGMSS